MPGRKHLRSHASWVTIVSRVPACPTPSLTGRQSMTDAQLASSQWIGYAAHEDLRRGDRPLLPDKDPFYQPPSGCQHARPGTVLRSRDVELAFVGRGAPYEPGTASSTVCVPHTAANAWGC